MTRKNFVGVGIGALLLNICTANVHAVEVQWSQPDLDRWMYPFNGTPGTRSVGTLFGAVGVPGFDDRDAQVLVGFDTSTLVPAGQAPASYQITKVTVTATLSAGTFVYDPTYDTFDTYQAGGIDTDPGRPVELYGVGFQGSYTELDFVGSDPTAGPGFEAGEAFGNHNPTPGTFDHDRSAFALGENADSLVDVSNNVRDGFDTTPFAVGTAPVAPGSDVGTDTTFTFDIDISDPLILAYLQSGLSAGQLGFVLSSMHAAAQGGPAVFPSFYLDEHFTGQPITLAIEFADGNTGGGDGSIPEPTSLALLVMSLAMLGRRRRRGCAGVETRTAHSL